MYHPETPATSDPVSHATPVRITRSAGDWVSFQLRREALERFVPRGARVLEVRAGVGAFTEVLHHLGCTISVLDESPEELELNRRRAQARGFEASIEGRAQRDICGLGDVPDASFDAVVAYGAALSHALERRDRALGDCVRVLRPRGVLVLDALSLWGTMHRHLPQVLARDLVQNRAIIRSGNAPEALFGLEHHATAPAPSPPSPSPPSPPSSSPAAPPFTAPAPDASAVEPEPPARHCHLFRAAELEAFLRRAGLEVLSLSASSALSTGVEVPLGSDPSTWSALLEYERAACVERGYIDSGSHLIAVARR